MNYAPPRQGIPLRPDRGAATRAAWRSFVRAVVAVGCASSASGPRPGDIVRKRWDDEYGAPILLRAASPPFTTVEAAALQPIAVAILDVLAGSSAGAALLRRAVQVSFDDVAAISLPTMTPGAASFIGEGAPLPVRQFATAGPLMELRKLGLIVELSNELLQSSNAENLVESVLVECCAMGLDAILFDALAGDDIRPPGLRFGVAGLTATTGGGEAAMIADIVKLVSTVAKVVGSSNIVLVAAEPQAAALNVRSVRELPYAVMASRALADGMVIAVGANALAASLEVPRIESTRQVTVHEADPGLPIVDLGGVMATPVRNTFQTDTSAIRIVAPASWALRTSGAVSWTSSTTW